MKENIILIEKNILPSENSNLLYLSFKIPYSNLIFIKKNENFVAGVKLEFDLFESGKLINRESIIKNIYVNDYNKTKSKDLFLEGITKFILLNNDNYTVLPTLSLENTTNTFVLDSIKINLKNEIQDYVFPPLIVEKSQVSCGDSLLFKLTNSQNTVPFSNSDYYLVVPVKDTSIKKIVVNIQQNANLIYEKSITEFFYGNLIINNCNDFIGIFNSQQNKYRYFIIDKFNYKLREGSTKLIILLNDKKVEFQLQVKWFNKPVSLDNVNFAVEILKTIEDNDVVMNIFQNSKKNLYESLINYWDKKLPNRKYEFNELMNEFYKRVDYANENFSTLTNKFGAKTDRGKIYIKYGKPDKILRDYSDNKVREIWIYQNINKEFTFTDHSGLGNFTLED
ncbi:GWxTD domain-containing protein [Rosettibacter firmus]|uniref:GWxTD domain-containing protein n=1 Tax=Rosettibacter firmus TaxID=3111522 RepID=UPI00336BB255